MSLAQSFGSAAHWHPHLHLVVSDGFFEVSNNKATVLTDSLSG